MANLSKPFIERPKATILLVMGFFVLGVVAYFQLPISTLPDVDFPTINVWASMPGASAENVARSIAGPLERALSNVPNVTSMTSTSSFSQTNITLQFALERDIDAAAQDVQAAINSASGLPKDLPSPPAYEKVNPSAFSILSLAATSETMPLPQVYDYVDNVISRALSQFPGVGVVDYHGDQVPAIRVQVDPTALAAHGLDLEDVRTALASATVDRPKGTLDSDKKTVILGANDQLLNANSYSDQIIAWRNGSPIRVRDVGRAIDGAEESKIAAWSQANRAIIIDVHKQSGAKVNVPVLVDRIKAALPALEASVPPAIKLKVVSDRTQTIRAQKVLERDTGLFDKKIIDRQSLDLQQATTAQLEALVKADEAAVANAMVQLEFTKITAPIDGRVGLRLVDRGNIVHANDQAGLAVITQLQPISVVFTLPEGNLREITKKLKTNGADESLTVAALDPQNNQVLGQGELRAMDNQVDEATGTIKLKAVFQNRQFELWPGQFVNIRLLVDTLRQQLVVPSSAVNPGPSGEFIYVIRPDLIAEVRPVKVGISEDGSTVIENGVSEGEDVVVDGQYLLKANARVVLKK